MKIEASIEIERPIADVWRWYAVDHVRNHPRWNPDLELEQISDGPIGLGTGLDDPEKARFIKSMMERSVANMKAMMEAEI